MNVPCQIMTADQVAELLQISRDMVYQLATRGELRGRKVGRIWRFSREAIDEFMRGGVEERPVHHVEAGEGFNGLNGYERVEST